MGTAASGVNGTGGSGRVLRRFPESSPEVCCAFLSSGRLHLLRRSLTALIRYFSSMMVRHTPLSCVAMSCLSLWPARHVFSDTLIPRKHRFRRHNVVHPLPASCGLSVSRRLLYPSSPVLSSLLASAACFCFAAFFLPVSYLLPFHLPVCLPVHLPTSATSPNPPLSLPLCLSVAHSLTLPPSRLPPSLPPLPADGAFLVVCRILCGSDTSRPLRRTSDTSLPGSTMTRSYASSPVAKPPAARARQCPAHSFTLALILHSLEALGEWEKVNADWKARRTGRAAGGQGQRWEVLRRGREGGRQAARQTQHKCARTHSPQTFSQRQGPEALEVYKDFDFERVALYRVNYGATHGFNTLLFDLCRRSRYVMTMEEVMLTTFVKLSRRGVGYGPGIYGAHSLCCHRTHSSHPRPRPHLHLPLQLKPEAHPKPCRAARSIL